MDREQKVSFNPRFVRNAYQDRAQDPVNQNWGNYAEVDQYHFEAPISQSQDRMIIDQGDFFYNEYRQEMPVSQSLYWNQQEDLVNYEEIKQKSHNLPSQMNRYSAIQRDNEGFVEVKGKRTYKKRNPLNKDIKVWMMEIFANIPESVIDEAIAKFKGNHDKICEYLAEEGEKASSPARAEPNDFNMFTYKTKPCKAKENCNNPHCRFYHFLGEKRRPPNTFPYSPELCNQYMNCPHKESCKKAHNPTEVLYHPQVFLSQPCPLPKIGDLCIEGSRCHFKHLGGNNTILEEINELKILAENKQKELNKVLGELRDKAKERDEMNKKIKCLFCKEKIREVMRIQCGHTFCGVCAQSLVCRICGREGMVAPIKLNETVF